MKKVLAGPVVLALGYQLDPRVQVEHCESPQMMEIVKKCPSLSNGFFPTPWLFNGVLQGIFGMGPGSSKNRRGNTDFVEYSREFFLMKDGGIMSVDWKEPRVHSKNVLLIIPGLSGGSGSEYVRTAVNQAHCAGFDVGVIHGRGIAGTPLKVIHI
jgi:predicted alpha/beta-fold hydrolase